MIVYKLPEGLTTDELKQFKGMEGSLLNPIEDAEGNLIISIEEWNADEFQYLKTDYPDIAGQFTAIEYKPKENIFNIKELFT